jgi:hypothetical protein
VEDVREFQGHIACDGDSRSEIAVPILVNERVSTTCNPAELQWRSAEIYSPEN